MPFGIISRVAKQVLSWMMNHVTKSTLSVYHGSLDCSHLKAPIENENELELKIQAMQNI